MTTHQPHTGGAPETNGQVPLWQQPAQTVSVPMEITGQPDNSPTQLLRAHLRQELSARLSGRIREDEDAQRPAMTPQQRRAFAEAILADAAETHTQSELTRAGSVVSPEVERHVIGQVLNEIFGLAGLEPLLADPEIENINITGDRVFVKYANGKRDQLAPVVGSDSELVELIRDLAARSGMEERRFDRGSPIVNFQLPGGARVSAVMAVTARPSVSIRRHRFTHATLAELRGKGSLTEALESLLAAIVRAKKNVLISGGTAVGKTTMLRALASAIPPWERLVTIEDVLELGLDDNETVHPDVVALQAREANIEGQGAITQSDLVWQSLRMSPDRVCVGEVRGPEVLPLLNAMSMGNDGSMGTIHSSTSRGAFTKLAAYAFQGPERLTLEAINLLTASALHFVVHLAWSRGEGSTRVVSSIREVVDADDRQIVSNEIFRPGPDLRAVPSSPMRTGTLDELIDAGYNPDLADRGANGWRP